MVVFSQSITFEVMDLISHTFRAKHRTLPLLLVLSTAMPPLPATAHGFLHERIGEMDRLVESQSDKAEPFLRRAELYREHGDFEAALADISRASKREPEVARVDLHRAKVYLDQGQLDAAAEATVRFLDRTQMEKNAQHLFPRAYLLFAEIAERKGKPLEAAGHIGKAITESERPAPTLFLKQSSVLANAGPEHADAAIEVLEAGMRKLGPLSVLQQRALELELARRDKKAALLRIETMIAAVPSNPGYLREKGRILEMTGKDKQAHSAYILALGVLNRTLAARRNSSAFVALRRDLEEAIVRTADSEAQPSPATR